MKSRLMMAFVALATVSVSRAALTLTFEGLENLEQIQDFYNGGTGSQGNSGPDYGITFSNNSLGLIDADVGGSGNTGLEPSGETTLLFLEGQGAILNYAAGFDTGFSFFYSAPYFPGSVSVWSGENASGSLLGTLNLTLNGAGPGDPNGDYSNWTAIGLSFEGIAKSIDFSGTANYIVFDNVTFGSEVPGGGDFSPVPEPATYGLMGSLGLLGLAAYRRKVGSKSVAATAA